MKYILSIFNRKSKKKNNYVEEIDKKVRQVKADTDKKRDMLPLNIIDYNLNKVPLNA
jgi:hypothetical protein